MSVYEEFDLGDGYKGLIKYDLDPEPFDGDTVGKIAYIKGGSYVLGDEAVSRERMDEIKEGLEDGSLIGAPIFAYVHGEATISMGSGFSCPWDSGQSGFVYTERKKALEEFSTEEAVLECLESEVKIFDNYLRGDVFGWVVEKNGEEVDSCWGFYGTDDIGYMVDEMRGVVNYERKKDKKEADEARYWAERDVVTCHV